MSRNYVVTFGGVGVTAQQDLFSIVAGAQRPLKVYGLFIGQSSDAGDAQDEQLRLDVIRGHTTVGSGGTAATPVPLSAADAAATFTARVNDTTVASAGTAVAVHRDAFNVRAGYQLWIPPEGEWGTSIITANTRLVVRLLTTPADSLTMSGSLYVRELY